MAINPTGSYITLDDNVLFVSDVRKSFATEPFDRTEFVHEKLRITPNAIGQHPLLGRLLGDTPAQIVIGDVSFQDVVPLNPDVLITGSNFSNIKKRFNIVRYEIQGAPTDTSAVEAIQTIATDHAKQLNKFQSHLAKASAMDTEYDVLIALQSETFTYLTTTGITLTGNSIEGTISNILITSFNASVEYEVPLDEDGLTSQVMRSFSLIAEVRTIVALDSVA